MRASHIPPFFWVITPFEASCFCHVAVHGDTNSYRDGRNSYQDDLNSYQDDVNADQDGPHNGGHVV